MWRLATLAVVVLISPTVASGQDYSFGDWARDHGYSPGDVMPEEVRAVGAGIDSLEGVGEFYWNARPPRKLWLTDNRISSIESGDFRGLTNLESLNLQNNQLSSIETGDFNGLTNLDVLRLENNQITSIESGAFSGLTHLRQLRLGGNMALTQLNLAEADFANLSRGLCVRGNVNLTSVSLRNTVVDRMGLAKLVCCGWGGFMLKTRLIGIGEVDATITEMDLSGVDFGDITDLKPLYMTDLEPLYMMDDLTNLWLVDTQNLDATDLDVLLDNLATIEWTDTEGVLYMTQADFDAFNTAGGGLLAAWDAEPGHHVEFLQIGDVNHDSEFNGLDIDPFVDVLLASRFDVAADMNGDGAVNGLDVQPFVEIVDFGGTQPIPEPSTLFLAFIALGVVSGWRKWAA